MWTHIIIPFFTIVVLLCPCLAQYNSSFLRVTAIVTNADFRSSFECWQFAERFASAGDAGIAGARTLKFLSPAEATYTVVPPHFNGGVHNAPVEQLVAFLAGTIRVSLPGSNGSDDLWIQGGRDGVVVAADTTGEGHATTYPSDQETIAIQIPFAEGKAPNHDLLHAGPCEGPVGQIELDQLLGEDV